MVPSAHPCAPRSGLDVMNVRAVGMALGDAMTARCDFVCVCLNVSFVTQRLPHSFATYAS